VSWNEELHPRNGSGEFTHASVGAWAKKAAEELGDRIGSNRHHPPGHAQAKARAEHLWSLGDWKRGTERTDAQQEELDQIEQAFETYRAHLGLHRDESSNGRMYKDDRGGRYSHYGEQVNRTGGYSRSASMRSREDRMMRRRGELRGRPDSEWEADRTTTMRTPETGTYRDWTGGFGYGARSEMAHQGAAEAFVAHMKRVQPRTRQETGRTAARRTPRGTRVSGWMDQAAARMPQRG
jgi:hypothetical protein